jgi:hypothetical protein
MYKVAKKIAVFMALCISLLQAQAGDGLPVIARDTLDPLVEFSRVREHYTNPYYGGEYTGDAFRYIVHEYSNDTLVSSDTMYMSYRVKKEKFAFIINNKMEYVQDEIYNAAVYLEDSVIYISNPQNIDPALFQIDIFNPSFYDQIDSISITDTAFIVGETRKLSLSFKPTSPYISYFVKFVQRIDQCPIIELSYRLKKEIVPAGTPVTSYTYVKMMQAGGVWTPVTEDTFSTKRFFKQENGVFVPVAPYTDFRIIDTTQQ